MISHQHSFGFSHLTFVCFRTTGSVSVLVNTIKCFLPQCGVHSSRGQILPDTLILACFPKYIHTACCTCAPVIVGPPKNTSGADAPQGALLMGSTHQPGLSIILPQSPAFISQLAPVPPRQRLAGWAAAHAFLVQAKCGGIKGCRAQHFASASRRGLSPSAGGKSKVWHLPTP